MPSELTKISGDLISGGALSVDSLSTSGNLDVGGETHLNNDSNILGSTANAESVTTFYGGGANQNTNAIHRLDFHNTDTSGAERVQAQIKLMPIFSGGNGMHMDFLVGNASSVPTRAVRLSGVDQSALFDGNVNISGVTNIGSYTVATLPTATARGFIYVSDETGGATMAFADGTNWRRVQDRAIVS